MVSKYLKQLKIWIRKFFATHKDIKLGLYGPPNAGKSTLANRITSDWLGEEMSAVSGMAHETREVIVKENITMEADGKKLSFNLVDTPGIATKIDFEDFVKKGMKTAKAKNRAKEATKGVIDAIKWLDNMQAVLVVLDATVNPINQVNLTILGNLEARGIPVLIIANKVDLKKASATKIREAFPQYEVIGISAKEGNNVDYLYKKLFSVV